MRCFAYTGKFAAAIHVLEIMTKANCTVTKEVFVALLEACEVFGRVDVAESLFDNMFAHSIRPDQTLFTALLSVQLSNMYAPGLSLIQSSARTRPPHSRVAN